MHFNTGKIPWNKGKHIWKNGDHPRGMLGKVAWNKGKKLSKSYRKKLSLARIGVVPWNKGLKGFKAGKKHYNWKGGRTVENGYVLLYQPNHPFARKGKVLEHRLVIEKIIGRHLESKEVVHHLGETTDNRPHMLMLFTSGGAHRRFHGNPARVKQEEIIFDGRKIKS